MALGAATAWRISVCTGARGSILSACIASATADSLDMCITRWRLLRDDTSSMC